MSASKLVPIVVEIDVNESREQRAGHWVVRVVTSFAWHRLRGLCEEGHLPLVLSCPPFLVLLESQHHPFTLGPRNMAIPSPTTSATKETLEAPSEPAPEIVDHARFNTGDFTLISSDNVRFRVASHHLMAAR
jgi:hypothetical protein